MDNFCFQALIGGVFNSLHSCDRGKLDGEKSGFSCTWVLMLIKSGG